LIKLITIDLDGTLFDSQSRISKENKEAIGYCIGNGIKVILSTGKSLECVSKVISELELVDYQIATGGTIVIAPDLKPILMMKISRESVLNAIGLARKNNIGFALDTTDGKLYFDRYYPEIKHIFDSGEAIEKVDDITDKHIVDNALLFTFTIDKEHSFNNILKKKIASDVKIRRGGPYFLNLLRREAGKVTGLKKILEIYNINRSEIMAIGDSNNDLGTIDFAGMGVAMGNAASEVINIADYVTEDNNNSGVAKAIYRFIRIP